MVIFMEADSILGVPSFKSRLILPSSRLSSDPQWFIWLHLNIDEATLGHIDLISYDSH